MPFCKRLSTLVCKHCGKNLCYRHAVELCGLDYEPVSYSDRPIEHERMHDLDGITATCCTEEVYRH